MEEFDLKILREVELKSDFYRNVQVWPLNSVINYRGWLDNFKDAEEKKLACHILNFFMFYPRPMIDQLLNTAVGRAGYVFSNHFMDWEHTFFSKRCIYSFIPGETVNATDSGHIFVRKLRNSLGIPEERIFDSSQLYDVLEDNANLPVILVDDFVGSGAQCCKAWLENRGGKQKLTLKELSNINKHKIVYAPLIVNYQGKDRIQKYCEGLTLVEAYVLGAEYNLFNPECICWRGDDELFRKGTALILNTSRRLGIPSTDGREVVDEKGFGKQGLALAFDDDGVPDAIPAFFYWCADNWTPLIKKEYKR